MAVKKTDTVAPDVIVSNAVTFGFDADPAAIAEACRIVAEATGQVIIPQVCSVSVPRVDDALTLPQWPVIEVLRVQYFDGAGEQHDGDTAHYFQTLDGGKMVLRAKPRRMWPNGAERDDAITVTYRAGYEDLPAGLRSMVSNLLP